MTWAGWLTLCKQLGQSLCRPSPTLSWLGLNLLKPRVAGCESHWEVAQNRLTLTQEGTPFIQVSAQMSALPRDLL